MKNVYKSIRTGRKPHIKNRQNIWTDMTLKEYPNDQEIYKKVLKLISNQGNAN